MEVWGLKLSVWSGSDPAQSSLSEAEIDMESSPSSWPKDTSSSMLAGGRKQSSGKETVEWGDHWVWRSGKTTLPPPGEEETTSARWRQWASPRIGHIAAGPENEARQVRAMSTVGLVQRHLGLGQAQAGNAVIVLIRRFYWSRADLANCSHNEFNRWSRRFWRYCCGHRIYTASRAGQYLYALRQLASHLDWREPIGLQESLKGRTSHNWEFTVMSPEARRGTVIFKSTRNLYIQSEIGIFVYVSTPKNTFWFYF